MQLNFCSLSVNFIVRALALWRGEKNARRMRELSAAQLSPAAASLYAAACGEEVS